MTTFPGALNGADKRHDTRDRAHRIRAVIRSEEQRLRTAYPWLMHQDLLGGIWFGGTLLAMGGASALYLYGCLAWWLAIPAMAFLISILHELEHDLIHDLYFKGRRWVQHLMFFVIWFCKLSLNPWYRRGIHLQHHRASGQEADIEERLIGLGLPIGLLRLLVTIHPMGGLFLFRRIKCDVPDFQPLRLALLSAPTYTLLNLTSVAFIGYAWTYHYGPSRVLPEWGWPWARDLMVLLVLPNVLRQACLVVMSSHSHYYGDIPERDVFFQNQILQSWLLFPFQLFCVNFGATHILHHYVLSQPFYLRHMVAPAARAEMKRQGTRINDFGSFLRANRWGNTAVQ